jgi:nitrite reductase (NO-forming)
VNGHSVAFHRFDPALPPVAHERTTRVQFTAQELPIRLSDDTVISAWTFDGDIPGPTLHVRQGDTVEFTLVNHGSIPHSMDFHASQIDPKVAFRSVAPGQSVSYTFRARFPGAFLYHCGTSPVLMHIGSGMVGAVIVDPPSPLPPAKEFVLVESEYYLGAPNAPLRGVQTFGVAPGGGMIFELLADIPGEFVFVNHGFGHGQKGAIGILSVES